jgi:hypothetical protein
MIIVLSRSIAYETWRSFRRRKSACVYKYIMGKNERDKTKSWQVNKIQKKYNILVAFYIRGSVHREIYRVMLKTFRDFRPLRYSSRDGHAEGRHVNRGTDTPSFCPTLQVLDMSTLGDAADVNPVIKFLPHTVNHVACGTRTCSLCQVIYHSCA